jgi:glycosyltransferase involved in cell wall biosynthesis
VTYRLLVVSHNYPRRSATGAGLFIHRLNRGLARLGVDVQVLQLADWAPPWPLSSLTTEWRGYRTFRSDLHESLDGIPIHHPETIHPRPSRFFDSDSWERQVRTLIRYVRRRPELARADAVMGHFLVPDGFHAVRLAQALDRPSAAMAWGDDVHAWPQGNAGWRSRLEVVLNECDQLIACSRQLATDSAAWSDRPTSWEVVYAGTDLAAFHQPSPAERHIARALPVLHSVPDQARILLMIGQPVKAKGYLEMLAAWEALAGVDDRWHLVMAGANWGNVDVAREISSRGLLARAHWIGAQPAAVMPVLLQASDGFVLPSHNEGLSLSVMEAMATRLPVIATDVGGHREVLRDGENGWLIPPRDVSALVRACRELMTDAAKRERHGSSGNETIREIGTPDDCAVRLSAVLERIIAPGRSSLSRLTATSRA